MTARTGQLLSSPVTELVDHAMPSRQKDSPTVIFCSHCGQYYSDIKLSTILSIGLVVGTLVLLVLIWWMK